MHTHKLTLAALALLLAGCASLASQRPTPTPTSAPAANQEEGEQSSSEAGDSSEDALVITEPVDTGNAQTGTVPATTAVPSDEAFTSESDNGGSGNTASPTNTPLVTVGSTAENTPAAATQPSPAEAPATSTTTTASTNTPAAVAAAQAQLAEGAYENLISPVDLIASYYNAVTRQEYERAYSYSQEPPLDYETFASGYGDTASVQVIVQPPTRIEGAAGSLYAAVPTFLVAQRHDGSVHSFGGCIVTRKSNLQPPDTAEADVWHLYQARLTEVDNNANIPALLASACES